MDVHAAIRRYYVLGTGYQHTVLVAVHGCYPLLGTMYWRGVMALWTRRVLAIRGTRYWVRDPLAWWHVLRVLSLLVVCR